MTLRKDLLSWISDQPSWQQDLARRLTSVSELSDEHRDEVFNIVLVAHNALGEGVSAPTPVAFEDRDLPNVAAAGSTPRLVGLGALRGVGTVADDQELSFLDEGITLVYGPNAAGKSSYVRALKRICRTVDSDRALIGNVFSSKQPVHKTARLTASVRGHVTSRPVDLDARSDSELDVISVFDARCAELYVNERNVVAYVPPALALLTRLVAAQNQLRKCVSEATAILRAEKPDFSTLPENTGARQRADGLAATTSLAELRSFCTLDKDETARLRELRAVLMPPADGARIITASSARREAGQADELRAQILALRQLVDSTAASALSALAASTASTAEAVRLAAEQFDAQPLLGIGSEPWQRLWNAARAFWETQPSQVAFPPLSGEYCPLCLQPVDDDAAVRMAHFEEHVRSELQREAEKAKTALDSSLKLLDPQSVQGARNAWLEALLEADPELHNAIEVYLGVCEQRMTALHADPTAAVVSPSLTDDPAPALERWAAVQRTHASTLEAAEKPEKRKALRDELDELESRTILGKRLDEAGAWIAAQLRLEALEAVYNDLHTGRVTRCQNELMKTAVTDALDARLIAELKELRCEQIPVDPNFRGTLGETHVQLQLVGARAAPELRAVLSEGEQRAVSLAFFFAEVACAEHDGGIVLDDPVSSLDDERRAYIAQRLVDEARKRQVIVFTHDLSFMFDLVQLATKSGIALKQQAVWRRGDASGFVDDKPPWHAMNLKQRVAAMADEVQEWNSQVPARNQDEAWRRVCDIYGRMRMAWEGAVEERLFNGVVQRFQREVSTQRLRQVDITDERIRAIEAGMTRCSFFVHDAPAGSRGPLPDRQQIAADLEPLRTFEKDTRA